ncbi:hypothetical protein [Pelagibacterium halotolerans]|uniref:hypothetical protein n=1 Tax=Pelagibacterium halotolerans TaxID=531813 RepID=UPI00384A6617
MGMLIKFSPRTARPILAQSVRREPAKVLLFTGIRYDRGQGVGGKTPARRQRRKG